MLSAVIFDFDGIIVDSEPMHHQAFLEILEPEGAGFTWEEYCKIFIGYDDRDAFREAFNIKGITKSAEQIAELIDQKAVCPMELNRVEAGIPCPPCSLSKRLNNFLDIIHGHYPAFRPGIARHL